MQERIDSLTALVARIVQVRSMIHPEPWSGGWSIG